MIVDKSGTSAFWKHPVNGLAMAAILCSRRAKVDNKCGPTTIIIAGAFILYLGLHTPAAAQLPRDWRALGYPVAGGEVEKYMRTLQIAGAVRSYPWSIRGFSFYEARRLAPIDSLHPWVDWIETAVERERGFEYTLLPLAAAVNYNSALPELGQAGPAWSGKGITTQLGLGVAAAYGSLSFTFFPVMFWAQNQAFVLADNDETGDTQYGHARYPGRIDLPQRFGDKPYARFDLGESTLRFDKYGIAVGISSAGQIWGPAAFEPLILGNYAGGVPHVFIGTSKPLDIWIGDLHSRLIWGRPGESAYSALREDPRWRFLTGYVVTFSPRNAGGLELGMTRIYHSLQTGRAEASDFAKPFEEFLKAGLGSGSDGSRSDEQNQLLSVFARWAFAPSGFEVYGEYAREDHNWDLRDILLEPDQQRAYMIGAKKVWILSNNRVISLSAEVANSQVSNILQVRGQAPFYSHTRIQQGHTHIGQPLGSPAVTGGGGSTVALDYYTPFGRISGSWGRSLFDEGGRTLPIEAEVRQRLGLAVLYLRDAVAIEATVGGTMHLNRSPTGDTFNANSSLGIRVRM